MPTERCAYLIAKGMALGVDEMWISEQPYLAMTYVSQYAPWLARLVIAVEYVKLY